MSYEHAIKTLTIILPGFIRKYGFISQCSRQVTVNNVNLARFVERMDLYLPEESHP
jgi:hypothetical protein